MGYFSLPGFDEEELKLFDFPYTAQGIQDQPLALDPPGGPAVELPPVSAPNPFASQQLPAAAPQGLPEATYMNPQRTQRLTEIDQALSELRKAQAGHLAGANTSPSMSGDQMFATAVASALPLILGRLFAGNTGGAIGGQVGLGIAKGTQEGYDKENKEKQLLEKAEYDKGKIEESDLIQQKRGLQTQGYAAEDALRLAGARDKMADDNRAQVQAFQKDLKDDPTYRDLHPVGGVGGGRQTRLETQAVQTEYNKIIGKSREQITALNTIETMLKDPTNISTGALRVQLARASGEVGNLAQQEQNRALPTSLWGDVKGIGNYITGGTSTTLTDAQKTAIQQYLVEKRAAIEEKVARATEEVSQRAPNLAPGLAQSGELQNLLKSLGSSIPQREASEEMVTIRNKRTGETKQVPASEAAKYGR